MIIRAVLLALVLAFAPPVLAAATTTKSTSTATLFAQQFPMTIGILQADFPQDLQALNDSFAGIDSTEISPQIKLQRAFLELTALRKKYAPQLQFARAELSTLVVLALADFYETVRRREGSEVCGGFAVDGAATLFTIGRAPAYARELDRQAAAYFSAVASAFEDPDVVGPATEDDWKAVMGRIVADGSPPSYVVSIAAPKISDPDLCPALSALFHAMMEPKSDAALRVRADFIQNATGY